MKKVLVLIPLREGHKKQLEQVGEGCEFEYCTGAQVTAEQVAGADIILGNVKPGLIGASEKLEWLHLGSSGSDDYVKPGVLHEKTILTNSTGAYSKAVAEHAFAMTLMLQKKLHLYRDDQRQALWGDNGEVTSIADATVVIVGLGEIGLHYARMAKALGARIIGVKRRPGECPACVDELWGMDGLDAALAQGDVIMSALPETPQTHHLFTRERFERMKSGAVFINVGRGTAVAADVLHDALRDGCIAAAGVDVTEVEPLPADSPLWKLPNLLITPHISGYFHLPETLDRVAAIAIGNLAAYVKGGELVNHVDFETGYRK